MKIDVIIIFKLTKCILRSSKTGTTLMILMKTLTKTHSKSNLKLVAQIKFSQITRSKHHSSSHIAYKTNNKVLKVNRIRIQMMVIKVKAITLSLNRPQILFQITNKILIYCVRCTLHKMPRAEA